MTKEVAKLQLFGSLGAKSYFSPKKKKKIMREGLKAGYDFKFFIFSPKFPKHFPLLLSHVAPSLPSSSATATERHPCHH
jgi:hypothetical protein